MPAWGTARSSLLRAWESNVIRPAPVAPPEALALSATEIAAGVNAGELDPAALVRACMEEIEASYDLFAVLARGYAAAIKRARQGVGGPLAGVPMLVSDTLDTAGLTTTLGSWIYRDRIPERSAAAVERLEQAGAIVIGKANVDEFGWGVTGENPHWGFAANPLRPDLVSGGACGGAAAGLAARVCALALGSDADGGLRVPAACCGTVAFKPASGRVERRGSLPLAPSFDAIGPMARSVRDCAVAYSVLVGGPVARPRVQGIRVGVLGAVPAVGGLESLGAVVEEIDLPRPRTRVLPAFLLECGLSRLSDYRERREQLGAGTRVLWDAARTVPAIDAWEARQALAEWQQRARTDPPVDLILTPTLGAPVPPRYPDALGPEGIQRHDGDFTRYAVLFGLLGWPTLAIGDLQITGRDEQLVLAVGLAYEEAFGSSPAGGDGR
jgi:aspartyl-tRNA(Asn)/glutamyl-tRNA(Gln) amidotransferase subunit A